MTTPPVQFLGMGEIFVVPSSKFAENQRVYIVVQLVSDWWACSCPYGSGGKECRHIREIKTKVNEPQWGGRA